MLNLASVVSEEDVLKALEKALKAKPILRKSTKFLLKYKNEFFPPKEVIRLAAIEKGIAERDFPKYRLAGGSSTNKYLERMGFEIEQLADWNSTKNKTIEKRIARLCWNTNGWVIPSGSFGKSINQDTHEAKFGYGHEEWLFDISKVIHGHHYGFLEPIRKKQNAYQDNIYDVWLYSIDGTTKKRYWIGEINKLEILNEDEAEKIKEEYVKRGWFQEMGEQIVASGANTDGFSDWEGVDLFNVRYLPSNLRLNDSYFEIPNKHPIHRQNRYSFAHFKSEFQVKLRNEGDKFSFTLFGSQDEDSDFSLKSKTYVREPKLVEILYLHRAMSKALTKELKVRYGNGNVQEEHPAGYSSNKIDIVVKNNNDLIFYEIKSFTSLRTSIREAIGQLKEYSFWPKHKKAKQLIIVTQPHHDFEHARIYFKHLRNTYNLPIYYQSYDHEKNILSELV